MENLNKDSDQDKVIGKTKRCYIIASPKGYFYKINRKTGMRLIDNMTVYTKKKLLIWEDEDDNKHTYSVFKLMYKTFIDSNIDYISNVVPKDGNYDNYAVDNLLKLNDCHYNTKPVIVDYSDGSQKTFRSLKELYNSLGIENIRKGEHVYR